MRMILLRFIVLLKARLEQMFIILKEVSWSGNRGGVTVLCLRNIKSPMSNLTNTRSKPQCQLIKLKQ